RRVQLGAVRPVDALPAGAAQRVRDARPLRGVQPQDVLACLAGQRPVGQVPQDLPGVLLALAGGVVGQVLRAIMEQSMTSLRDLLCQNRNYRYTWMAQVVSEVGDYFNNIAVFALVMEKSGSGLVVMGVMLARAIPAVIAGPVAGVLLDRLDRRRIMICSDLVRASIALGFVVTVHQPRPWLLYVLSAGLMFASPFFTAGRAAILP